MHPSRSAQISLALVLCIGTLMFWYRGSIPGSQDVGIYERIGQNVLDARKSDGTVTSEYPPLASATFAMIEANPLDLPFGIAWPFFLLLLLCGSMAYLAVRIDPREAALFAGGMLATVLLLGQEVLFARYDIIIGILFYLTWRLHARGHHTEAGAFLTIASFFKIVPALLFPLVFFTVPKGKRRLTLLGACIGTVISIGLPLLVMGADGFASNILHLKQYHGSRGIQVESTWSGLQLLWSKLHGIKVDTGFVAMSVQNMSFGGWMVTFASILIFLAVAVLTWRAWQKAPAQSSLFPRFYLAAIALILALSPIFSPQYMVWLMPLLVVWYIERFWLQPVPEAKSYTFLALLLLVGLGTQWVYPHHYGESMDQSTLSVIAILNARNIGLFVLAWLLVNPAFHFRPTPKKLRITLPHSGKKKRRTFLVATLAFLVGFGIWAGFRQTLSLDIRNVQYSFAEGELRPGVIPLFVPTEDKRMDVQLELHLPRFHVSQVRIKPDDCIESLEINGTPVDDEKMKFCDYDSGRTLSLARYLQPGANTLHFVLRDDGGLGGVNVSLDRADLLVLFSDLLLLALIGGYAYAIYRIRVRKGKHSLLPLVFAAGTMLRVLYYLVTPYTVRGHDTDAHIDYIQYLVQHFAIPEASTGWEYHQPPLYYAMTAIWYWLGGLLGRAEGLLLIDIQFFSLVCALITLGIGLWIGTLIFDKKDEETQRTIFGLLIATIPSLIFVTARINNDVLYQPLVFGLLAFLIKWWKHGKLSDWYVCCLLFALAFITKISVAAFGPVSYTHLTLPTNREV